MSISKNCKENMKDRVCCPACGSWTPYDVKHFKGKIVTYRCPSCGYEWEIWL